MVSSLEWTVRSYVGLNVLLCILNKSLKAKPFSGTGLTDNVWLCDYAIRNEEFLVKVEI